MTLGVGSVVSLTSWVMIWTLANTSNNRMREALTGYVDSVNFKTGSSSRIGSIQENFPSLVPR